MFKITSAKLKLKKKKSQLLYNRVEFVNLNCKDFYSKFFTVIYLFIYIYFTDEKSMKCSFTLTRNNNKKRMKQK